MNAIKPDTHIALDLQKVTDDVRLVVETLLERCQVPYKVTPYEQQFYDKCCSKARERGYPMSTDPAVPSILPFLPTGVTIAATGYKHIESESTRILIALYTACCTYLDDLFQRDVDKVYLFNERFVRQQKHDDPVLDALSDTLGEIDLHYDRTASNIIVTDTLNFVNSLLLDYETQGIKRSNHALGYPNFIRLMSGIPSAYMMFIFPPHIPLRSYVQAFPEMRTFICYLNDVLSFYKEEIRGETDNYISMTAESCGLKKFDVLQTLSTDVANANDQILKILEVRLGKLASPKATTSMSRGVWFVTGASVGLGRAVVEHALTQGSRVVATLRKPEALSSLSSQYPPSQLLVVQLDVTSPSAITAAFAKAIDIFERVDVVYNNAGYAVLGEIEGTPDKVARAMFEVDFWGATNVAREAVKIFRDVNKPCGGRLMQASSLGGIQSTPGLGYYCASKFALEAISEAISKEMHPSWNIRVIIIQLGGFATRVFDSDSMVTVSEHQAYTAPDNAVKRVRELFSGPIHAYVGDPRKAAREIYKISNDETVELRVALGLDAIEYARGKAKDFKEIVEATPKWSVDLT